MSNWIQLLIVILLIALFAWWDMRPVRLSEEDQKLYDEFHGEKHYHDDCE